MALKVRLWFLVLFSCRLVLFPMPVQAFSEAVRMAQQVSESSEDGEEAGGCYALRPVHN